MLGETLNVDGLPSVVSLAILPFSTCTLRRASTERKPMSRMEVMTNDRTHTGRLHGKSVTDSTRHSGFAPKPRGVQLSMDSPTQPTRTWPTLEAGRYPELVTLPSFLYHGAFQVMWTRYDVGQGRGAFAHCFIRYCVLLSHTINSYGWR